MQSDFCNYLTGKNMSFLLSLFLSFFCQVFCQALGYGLDLRLDRTLADNPTLLIPQSSLVQTALPLGEEDEVKIVEQLIFATVQQLETEKHLKNLMLQFKKQREEFIQGNQTKAHAGRMVRTARQIYETITANHFEHLFAKDYLDELTFFSSIAGKTAMTRP
jgi:hypothetical protein